MELLKSWAHHGGVVRRYRHVSASTGTAMSFVVFLPAQALGEQARRVPVIYFLAGLECTDETFAMKGGAFAHAAKAGVAFVCPDTSPRGAGVPGEAESWDFGVGAGFYIDATQAPWSAHWRMFSYVTSEVPALVAAHLPIDPCM
jgi:S-formylglutathione hydrolase